MSRGSMRSEMKELVILLLLILPPSISSNSLSPEEGIKVKVVPPIYSVEIKNVALYEASIPIFFHVKLPKLPEYPQDLSNHLRDCSDENNSNNNHYPYCNVDRQFSLASLHIIKDLELQRSQSIKENKDKQSGSSGSGQSEIHDADAESVNNSSSSSTNRRRRQAGPVLVAGSLLAGFLMRPAISKFTAKMFGSEREWAEHFNSIRNSLLEEHQLLVDFEHSTESYTAEMTKIISNMSEILTDQKRDLIWSLRLLSTKIHADMIQDAIQSCKSKQIPGSLIRYDLLQSKLESLNKNLSELFNYTLSINHDLSEIGKYYKLPITDCFFTQDKVHIVIRVPLQEKNAQWTLHELIHTKYAFDTQVCEVYPHEAAYLARDKVSNHSLLITKHLLRHCSVSEHQLCMIPQFGKDSAQSLRCSMAGLEVGNSLDSNTQSKYRDELLRSCSFRCYTSNELIITQIEERKIVVTNADNLTYHCDNGKKGTVQVDALGAVEINLNCECSVEINGNVKLPKPFPCPIELSRGNLDIQSMISFTVPILWTQDFAGGIENLNTLEDHRQLRSHINNEWSSLIPVLNFTKEMNRKVTNFSVPEAAEVKESSAFTNIEAWLFILSLTVFLQFILTFYCLFKLAFLRVGGYDLCSQKDRCATPPRHGYYHSQSQIPPLTTKCEQEEVKVVRREAKNDDYRSNRNSVINKLI